MKGELKDKVARGVAWSMAEKIGTMLLQMAVSLIILRLLTRDILGVMAIPTAVVAVALVLVDSGFSQALIRKAAPSADDYKSVFAFNIGVSLVMYALFTALAFPVSRFYDMPQIAQIAPVFFLQLPIGALCAIQNTICVRQFRFALLSKVTFASSLAGGLAAIGLALAGFGIWCIVAQRVLQAAVRTLLLWWLSDWRPCGACSRGPLREMAPFSFSLIATDLISTFYNKIPQFFLGRLYPADTLGSFDQAIKLKDQPTISAMQAVQSVTFPALAKIRDDAPKFAESYRQVVMVVSYVLFPVMLGMSAVAHDMFAVLLGEEWMPTVPYFETVCLVGLFYPMSIIAYNVLKVKSGGCIDREAGDRQEGDYDAGVRRDDSDQRTGRGMGTRGDRILRNVRQFPRHDQVYVAVAGAFRADAAASAAGGRRDVRRGAADGPRDSGACPAAADGRSDGRCGLLCPAVGPVPARSLPRGGGYCPEAVFAPLIRAACVGGRFTERR